MYDFPEAVAFILKEEGGYVYNRADPGGATKYGITQRVFDPTNVKNVKFIMPSEAEKIYQKRYWFAGQCNELPWPFSLMHFDACVNVGKPENGFKRSVRILQRAVGAKDDGVIGARTLGQVQLRYSSVQEYIWERLRYYVRVSRINPRLREFTWMWLVRMDHLRTEASK